MNHQIVSPPSLQTLHQPSQKLLPLYLPELLNHIFQFLDKDNALYPAMLVNKEWHDCAARILWKRAAFEDTSESIGRYEKFAQVFGDWQKRGETLPTTRSMPYSLDAMARSTITSNSSEQQDINMIMPQQQSNTFELGHDLSTYRRSLRHLSLRKIKEKSINESLCAIANKATLLTNLDIYICDHLEDDTVIRFATFHITPTAPISSLTQISLAGCHRITDTSIISVANHCPMLEHLDLRACGLVSDLSISAVALNCPQLRHLNVGRIRDRERITITSIRLIAQRTKAAVLGLAGCDIDDECMLLLAQQRKSSMERISVNNCYRITNESIRAFVKLCPRLSVFEMKECHLVNDWASVAELVNRKVLLTLCEQQNKACLDWAKSQGKSMKVRAPVK
ncbi:hypothetical protein BC943DRAFT_341117 [Umbelopsis sp. AD052]|nr:hypothetical protein BC943DRAFT_341117 [Umbelopsis sp. AD052]